MFLNTAALTVHEFKFLRWMEYFDRTMKLDLLVDLHKNNNF